MKKEWKKKLFSALFFIAVFLLTFWYVLHEDNPKEVLYYLSTAELGYIVPAVFFVIAFILGESVVIHYLLKALGTASKFFHCCLYSFIGFFYSAITPSASGGQPMQMLAMHRDGIPGAVSAVVLGIVTVTYKLVLVLIGLAVLIIRPASVMVYLEEVEALVYLGLVLNVVFVIFLLAVIFNPALVRSAAKGLFSLVNRIRPFSNPDNVMYRLESVISSYSGTAAFFKENPRIIVHVFFITLVQRFCLFSVVWFTALAFGLHGQSPVVMILLYAMISVAVDMLPLPGGMGISETLFLTIFDPIFGEDLIVPGMMICRGISYYTQLIISAVMTGFAHFFLKEKRSGKESGRK